jgi:hypothetical protein
MEEVALCNIVLSPSVSEEDLSDLSTALRMAAVKVEQPTSRVFGVEEIALFVSIVVGAAQLAEYGVRVGKAINDWRRKIRQKGKEPKGRLEHPEKAPIDLWTATDAEVEEWLSH